jgi:DNA-binding response OmpR family regulator
MLPGLDGWGLIERARDEGLMTPILAVSARGNEHDKVATLSLGADDYLAKPFSTREVAARVQALLRRPRLGLVPHPVPALATVTEPAPDAASGSFRPIPQPRPAAAATGLVVDRGRRMAVLDGSPLPLTPVEVDVILAMADRPAHAWSATELGRTVWPGGFSESTFLLDVHIGNIRRKLEHAGGGRWVTPVGDGYRFAPA